MVRISESRVVRAPLIICALVVLIAFVASLAGCGTVTFVREAKARHYDAPAYERSQPFWFFGSFGASRSIDLSQACLTRSLDQYAMSYSKSDLLTALFTLGIYTPRSVQVWCGL